MELAHAHVLEPAKIRSIIVGMWKASCGDEHACWVGVRESLDDKLGTECCDSWIKEDEKHARSNFVGIENRDAKSDPMGSGMEVWKRLSEGCTFLTEEDVEEIIDDFPGINGSRERRRKIAIAAMRHIAGTGCLVLLEEDERRFRVFVNPQEIKDFVRMMTGSERTTQNRLERGQTVIYRKSLSR